MPALELTPHIMARDLAVCGRGLGRGFGSGRGRGLGFRRGFGLGAYANDNYSKDVSKEILQAQKKHLQMKLDAINKRLESL